MLISERLLEIHEKWGRYTPYEAQYFKFEPNIIGAGHKISDVYQTFCLARFSLMSLDNEDFGQMVSKEEDGSHNDINMNFIKSVLIQNALMYYNNAVDISWQVLVMYCDESGLDLIYKEGQYKKVSSCEFLELKDRIRYWASSHTSESKTLEILHDHINDFFNGPLTQIREKYNYLKHRGTYYFPGLGMNLKTLSIGFNGMNPMAIAKEEFKIDEWKEILISFDLAFVGYFQFIIDNIMPSNYLDGTIDLGEVYNYGKRIEKYLNEKI